MRGSSPGGGTREGIVPVESPWLNARKTRGFHCRGTIPADLVRISHPKQQPHPASGIDMSACGKRKSYKTHVIHDRFHTFHVYRNEISTGVVSRS